MQGNENTPLHLAVLSENIKEVGLLLEMNNTDVNIQNNDGNTPLHLALGNLKIVRLLLEMNNIDVNIQNNDGNTPLLLANSENIILELLKKNNTNIEIENKKGETIIYKTVFLGQVNIFKILILKNDIEKFIKTYNGNSLLHLAILYDHFEIVKLLLEIDEIDVNIQNKDGNTPLHMAILYDHFEIVELLLEIDEIDVNIQNKDGNTPLHICSVYNRINIVSLLLNEKINSNIQNNQGKTPLQLANDIKHKKIIDIITNFINKNNPNKYNSLLKNINDFNNFKNSIKINIEDSNNENRPECCKKPYLFPGEYENEKNIITFIEFLRSICSQFKKNNNKISKTIFSIPGESERFEIILNQEGKTFKIQKLKDILLMRRKPILLGEFRIKYGYGNAQGIGEGVNRHFFEECLNQLKNDLFEKEEDEKTGILKLKQLNLDSIDVKLNLVIFGYIMAFYLVNNISFDFQLSIILLYYCIYKTDPNTDPAYIFLLWMEDKEEIISYLNLLKTPDSIEDLGLELYNTIVTKDNIISFIQEFTSKLTVPSTYKYIMYGFNFIVNIGMDLEKANISPFELRKLLCVTDIDIDSFIKDQLIFSSDFNDEKQKWFKEILKELTEKKDLKKKLFNFWGSVNIPIRGKNYKVAQGNQRGCFQSHTCFYTIDMPNDINNKDIMREKLLKSIEYVECDIGLVGGRRRKSKLSIMN